MKRAIILAGGGPAAGLHIGVLEALHKAGITYVAFHWTQNLDNGRRFGREAANQALSTYTPY